MAAFGAKYGLETSHFYWIGAIPAMAFVGVLMMPFYYGSRARSVPEYLRLRFDEKTRAFNVFTFALMTIFSSGIFNVRNGEIDSIVIPARPGAGKVGKCHTCDVRRHMRTRT